MSYLNGNAHIGFRSEVENRVNIKVNIKIILEVKSNFIQFWIIRCHYILGRTMNKYFQHNSQKPFPIFSNKKE